MITIHCSALPRVLACPASLQAPALTIIGDSEASALGRAVHEALAISVRGDRADIKAISAKYGVKEKDVAVLHAIGMRDWNQYMEQFGFEVVAIEQEMSAVIAPGVVELVGRGDVIAKAGGSAVPTIVAADWKSGSGSADHGPQVLGYAYLARMKWAADAYFSAVFYLRDQEVELTECSAADLDELPKRIMYAVEHQEQYNPGDACTFCPRVPDCPARMALVQQGVRDFATTNEAIDAMPAEVLASKFRLIRMVKSACEHAEEVLKVRVAELGPLPDGNGGALTLKQKPSTKVNAEKALPLLLARFGSAEALAPALTIGKGKLEDLAKQSAPRGKGAATIRAMLDELEEADALEHTTSYSLAVVKEQPAAIGAGKEEEHGREQDGL